MQRKRYRLKSRIRFTVFVSIFILAMLMSTNSLLGMYNAASLSKTEYKIVEISSGDTLWHIASEYMPETEIRQAVHKICLINDTSAAQIQPGQIIKIPVE